MSMIRAILSPLTRRRRNPTSSSTTGASIPPPVRSTNMTPAARPATRGATTASTRRTRDNPTGAAAPSTRSADDDWPSPFALIDQLPPALPAHADAHQHHCQAQAPDENVVNHTSSQSSACHSDDYNRNASSGTPE